MRFFLVFLTLSLHLCESSAEPSNSERRFHFGHEAAEPDIFFAPLLRQPWFFGLPLEYICGGTWIHQKFVLTSAYCLKYHDINRVGFLEGERTEWKIHEFKTYKIDSKHYFGNFSLDNPKVFEDDIGLVKVIMKVGSHPGHPSGVFPSLFNGWGHPEAIEKDQVTLFGFGRTESGDYAPKLKYMKGRLHFADNYFKAKCTVPSCKKGLSFCFEPQARKDRSDNGDMGSPVYYKVGDPDHTRPTDRVIIGILSNSINDPWNIILTNVTHYQGWINSIIPGSLIMKIKNGV